MGVKFLSAEWAQAATEALSGHAGYSSATEGVALGLQFKVLDPADGPATSYYVTVVDGVTTVRIGAVKRADVSVTTGYEIAEAISKGEMSIQMAFLTGRLKVAGNLAKLMLHQAALGHLAEAVSTLDIDY